MIHDIKVSRLLILTFWLMVAYPGFGQVQIRKSLPEDRLGTGRIDTRLELARMALDANRFNVAAAEIARKVGEDSSLVIDACRLLGGNYHLIRLTDNIFADRVGDFSPSGSKIIYARDTSFIRQDDGVFDWYDDRTTGIICYDFSTGREAEPVIIQENPFRPRFNSETSFFFLSRNDGDQSPGGLTGVYLHDLELDESTKCFSFRGQYYSPANDMLVIFDNAEERFILKDLRGSDLKTIFDNNSLLTLKRPLPLIQNISAGNEVLMFEAGFSSGNPAKNIYSLPLDGGKPKVMTTELKEFLSDGAYYPAAVNKDTFALLVGGQDDLDIHYRFKGKACRLTFDGGKKNYLAISPDGLRIAYSFMVEKDGLESYEIFLLDFSQDATADDLMYRINNIK